MNPFTFTVGLALVCVSVVGALAVVVCCEWYAVPDERDEVEG